MHRIDHPVQLLVEVLRVETLHVEPDLPLLVDAYPDFDRKTLAKIELGQVTECDESARAKRQRAVDDFGAPL